MKKPPFALLVGLLLMLWGVSGVTSMATRAAVAGYDGSVANNVCSISRLALVGIVGSSVASELIQRDQERMILDNGVRTSRQAQNQTPPAEEAPK
ncbi:hypothetical protein OAP17_09190 [Porticoccaceae bacterium]|nr:hypothetical protein [Porticoccaceae bacterium]